MKILHLIPDLNFGGAESVLLQFCEVQKDDGNEVHIATFSTRLSSRSIPGVQIHNCSNIFAQLQWSRPKQGNENYEKVLDDLEPDIVHSHSESSMLIALANKRSEIGYVFHFHRFPKESSLGFIKKLSESILIKRLIEKYGNTEIVAVSTALKNRIQKHYRLSKRQIHILGNPIKAITEAKEFNWGSGIKILSVTRLENEKNILQIPEIVKELEKLDLQFQWTIYGDGSLKNALLEKIEQYNIKSSLFVKNASEDIQSSYSDYNVYISVSRIETFGLSILEAMAKGLAVILLPNEGSMDFIENGENAFVIEQNDSSGQAKRISEILKTPVQKMKEISSKAIETSREFEIKKIYSKLKEIYSVARTSHR